MTLGARAVVVAMPVVCVLAPAWAARTAPSAAHAAGLVDRVRSLNTAVIHGDLAAVRDAATWVSAHAEPAALPGGTEPLLGRLREAATAVIRAGDVAGAATAAARLSASCGGCHEAASVTPTFPRATPPAFGSIAGHMVRHQDAADLMLEGLIVPSAAAWTRGAGQLSEAPLKAGDFPVSDRVGALMSEIETRMHAHAADAATATDTPGRTRAYSRLLAICAECHTRHTTLWDPRPR